MKKKIIFTIISLVLLAGLAVFYKLQINPNFLSINNEIVDNSLKNIQKNKKIIVGVYKDFAPMTFLDAEKNNIGYDIDLMREIAVELNVEIEFKEMNFSDLFTAVEKQETDVAISSITITPEREEKYLFSKPYFTSGQTILVRSEDERIKSSDNLIDKKIGVPHASTCEIAAKEKVANVEQVIGYRNNQEIQALLSGEVDAVVHDYSYAAYTAKNNTELKLVGDPFTQEFYGIMTNKKNISLMNEINSILRDTQRSGRQNELHKKWFGQ